MELESAAVGEEPPAAGVVDLRQANAELQRRLDDKDVEIAALKERLAALEAAIGGGSSGSSSSTDGPAAAATHIGDYHAIGSRSLPLLSAAHVSRLNTMSNNHGGAPSPSSARQQQQQQQAQEQPPPLPQQGAGGNTNPPEPVHQTDTVSIRRRYMALERGAYMEIHSECES